MQTIIQPATNVVTGWASTLQHFVVASASAKISRPALAAWRLKMNVTLRQPAIAFLAIDAAAEIAHLAGFITNETMARVESPVGRDSQISRSSSAGIGPVGALVYLAHGIGHIEKRIAITLPHSSFKLCPAVDHLSQHLRQIGGTHFRCAAWRTQHGRKSHAVKSHACEGIQRVAEIQIFRRHGNTRRNLHATLPLQQRLQPAQDAIITPPPVFERTQTVVHCAMAIKAYGNGKSVPLEEFAVFSG